MKTVDTEILKHIAQNTDSSLILFFLIAAVILVPVGLLLMKHSKHRHEVECRRREQDRAREQNIIQVITGNTEVMAGIKATLEVNNSTFNASLSRIHDRIDSLNEKAQFIKDAVTRL